MASIYDEKKSNFYRPRPNNSSLSPERRRRATYILCLVVGAIVTLVMINGFGTKKVAIFFQYLLAETLIPPSYRVHIPDPHPFSGPWHS